MTNISMPARRGFCLVLAAPSGAGKSSLARAMLQNDPRLTLSMSATTRAPREGEVDGVDYGFCRPEDFAQRVERGEMLEHATVFGRSYGTPRAPVVAALERGEDVVFDVDWQGHRQLHAAIPDDVVGVFILPPSLEALRARLDGRGDSPEAIAGRMAKARDEISHWAEFDYLVVNDDFEAALAELRAIVTAQRCLRARRPDRAELAQRLANG